MKIIEGRPYSQNVGEPRVKYVLSDSVMNLIYLPPNAPEQKMHKSYLVKEATYVIKGRVEVCAEEEDWTTLDEGEMVEFEPSQYHNMRVPKFAGPTGDPQSAVTATFKWIPAGIKLTQEESTLFLTNDWFPPNGCSDDFIKLSEEDKRIFWDIVERYSLGHRFDCQSP